MESTEDLINAVKTYLKSHYMLAYETWIEGCVDYLKEVVNTVEEIQTSAYEQWLSNDIEVVSPGSLPPNLRVLQKTVLNGRHVLQINKAIDISVPAYQQYLKLKNANTENITATMTPEEKITSKRMLLLELTDGKQTISGIEYETISKLAGDFKPGCKILITGPVQCRQGVLLLTNGAVEYLAGEVSDLFDTCSLAAQLCAKLELSITEDLHSTEVTQSANGISGSSGSDNSRNTGISTETRPEQEEINAYQISTEPINQFPVSSNRTPELQVTNANSITQPINEVPITIEEDILDDYDFNDIPVDSFGKRELGAEDRVESSVKKIRLDTNPANEYPDDMDEDDFFVDEEHLREIENQFEHHYQSNITRKGPTEIASEPFVYIKQINEMSDSAKNGKVFRVKAQILAFRTKLTLSKEWSLKCTLTDGTGCIDVEFASYILSKFLGFTPQDISELKKNIAANPSIKEKVNLAFKKTNKELETLYCIMELTMYALPKITRIIEFDRSHIDLLERRLDASGL